MTRRLLSTGGSRAANRHDLALRASCRSNLYGRAHLPAILTFPTVRHVLFLILLSTLAMNSPAPLLAIRVDHASSEALSDCVQQTVVQLHETRHALTAHNDRLDPKLCIETMQADDLRSPLRVLAVGTACLFATMAAVMAFG